ncbi:hypothetical protein ACIRRA_41440 [Nocardia sp. NPDC101769]|uniref:hypothetical protein n=1 Tax=Nocardia sp. NPDC101769 TaxID=3364333 RepID=UPI003803E88A
MVSMLVVTVTVGLSVDHGGGDPSLVEAFDEHDGATDGVVRQDCDDAVPFEHGDRVCGPVGAGERGEGDFDCRVRQVLHVRPVRQCR